MTTGFPLIRNPFTVFSPVSASVAAAKQNNIRFSSRSPEKQILADQTAHFTSMI